jgi:hypothetical protein
VQVVEGVSFEKKMQGNKEAVDRGGNGSNMHGYEFECYSLSYFSPDSDTNSNIFGYEYKTDSRI